MKLIKKTNDLSWSVKINQKHVDYKFIDYNENIYLKDDAKLFAHYKKIDKAIKILDLIDRQIILIVIHHQI